MLDPYTVSGVRSDEKIGLTVVSVRPILLSAQFDEQSAQGWSGGVLAGTTVALVEVTADDGRTGLGEAYIGNFVPGAFAELVRSFTRNLIGRDVGELSGIMSSLRGTTLYWGRYGLGPCTLSAIEMGLWDLLGKALDTPVYKLLSPTPRSSVPAYASGGMDADAETLSVELQGYKDRGFKATKIRIGYSGERDREIVESCANVLDSNFGLAVDCVQGSNPQPWDGAAAVENMRALDDFDLLWIEEPCAADDPEGYKACRDELNNPIAGGETATNMRELDQFIDIDAVDILQPDAAHLGGILPTVLSAQRAATRGMAVATHAWSGAACVMGNLHAALASPNAAWQELPQNGNPFRTDFYLEPLTLVDGEVQAPTSPGLGIALPEGYEERFPFNPDCVYEFRARR